MALQHTKIFIRRHRTNSETRINPLSSYGGITGITILYERSERLCHQFFQQNKNNAKITEFFAYPYTSNYDLRLPRKYLFIYLTLPIMYTYIHTRITYYGQMAGNTLQLTPIEYDNYVCKTDRFKHSFLPQSLNDFKREQ